MTIDDETWGKIGRNVYHCCVQKTASQWIKTILTDPVIHEASGLQVYTPHEDYIMAKKNRCKLLGGFPVNTIVSPLYARYEEFSQMAKPDNYRVFFVMRDPRDLVISRYFSEKYSHPRLNEWHEKNRKFLNEIPVADGLECLIESIATTFNDLYSAMYSWLRANDDPHILVCKYEDLIGAGSKNSFSHIFTHCGIDIPAVEIAEIVDRYSFEKLSQGRKQGDENVFSHYRKGISGDWKNYFDKNHILLFKRIAGQLLIDLGYERNIDW